MTHANDRPPLCVSCQRKGGGYEEQMTVQASTSGGQQQQQTTAAADGELEAQQAANRDAQETSEDAQLIKRFKLVGLVGTGNYARVYKGLSHNGRELAIKSINISKTSDIYKQRFLHRELTILRKISHPNICKIHEILHIADRIFIIMQFCSRGTIADLLHKHGPLSEPVTRHLFVQTNEAVAYLHSLDIAHRDIKVENILLDAEQTPKLTDFSYSTNVALDGHPARPPKSAGRHMQPPPQSPQQQQQQAPHKQQQQQQGNKQGTPPRQMSPQGGHLPRLNETFCGTLPYLAPEIIRQTPYDARKADVWSLGVCLFVMLNDRLPFPFNDVRLMIKKQLARDYKFKAQVEFSEQVRELTWALLEPEFAKRPTSAEVARHAWMQGAREKPPP